MATRERPVTQPDVAKLAGVSRGLVSQALSGDGRMSPSTRARILETAEQLGYYPHSAASELAGGHSKRLVLILPYLTNPYFDELSSHLRVAASARGYSLIVMVSDLLSHGADLAQYVVGASTRSSPSPTHSSRSARFPRRWCGPLRLRDRRRGRTGRKRRLCRSSGALRQRCRRHPGKPGVGSVGSLPARHRHLDGL